MLNRAFALLAALPLLLVLLWLLIAWHTPAPEIWMHLRRFVLPEALATTAWVMFGVALIASALGIGCAWFNAVCEYPGRRFMDWAMLLPLALPTYVMAYAWIGLTEFAGPLQTIARASGLDLRAILNLSTPWGAAWVLGLVLFPYVYVPVRASLLVRGWGSFEAARTLGLSPREAFFRVSLPLIWPAWAAGLSLALMETLADFGAVSILNVQTLTPAIFKTWFGLQSLPAAAQLASLMLGLVALLLLFEQAARSRRGFSAPLHSTQRLALRRMTGWLLAAGMGCVLALAFVLPVSQIVALGTRSMGALKDAQWLTAAANSLMLGLASAALLALLALLMSALKRRAGSDKIVRGAAFVANLGYALPGVVLALGLLLPLIALQGWLQTTLGVDMLLTSGFLALLLAYAVRFWRVAQAPIDAAFLEVRPNLLDQARLFNLSAFKRLRRVWLPLLRPGVYSALILVTVEVIKELPATLMLRGFGFETLATRVYAFTSEGEWQRAAWPALLLVVVGLLPVIALIARSRRR